MRRVRLAVATAAVLLGVVVMPSQASGPQLLVLSGSRTAWVDVTLSAPLTFDLFKISATYKGRFTGFYIDGVTAAQRTANDGSVGTLIARDLRVPGEAASEPVFLWNRSKTSQTIAPGHYRFYLLADGPTTVRIPLQSGRGLSLRPTHPTAAAVVSDPDILINPLQADNAQRLTVVGARSLDVSTILVGRFRAFAGEIGACFRKPEAKCGSSTNGGVDGPGVGTVVDPFGETDVGFDLIYQAGALPPGRYEAWPGATNAAVG